MCARAYFTTAPYRVQGDGEGMAQVDRCAAPRCGDDGDAMLSESEADEVEDADDEESDDEEVGEEGSRRGGLGPRGCNARHLLRRNLERSVLDSDIHVWLLAHRQLATAGPIAEPRARAGFARPATEACGPAGGGL